MGKARASNSFSYNQPLERWCSISNNLELQHNRRTMKLLIFASVLITALARPQEVMSPDEVELVQPGRSESETAGGSGGNRPPFVFVVRGVPRFPGLGSFFGD